MTPHKILFYFFFVLEAIIRLEWQLTQALSYAEAEVGPFMQKDVALLW